MLNILWLKLPADNDLTVKILDGHATFAEIMKAGELEIKDVVVGGQGHKIGNRTLKFTSIGTKVVGAEIEGPNLETDVPLLDIEWQDPDGQRLVPLGEGGSPVKNGDHVSRNWTFESPLPKNLSVRIVFPTEIRLHKVPIVMNDTKMVKGEFLDGYQP